MSDGSPLVFVTSNPNKAIEAERILGVRLIRADISLPEIQAPAIEDITLHKLEAARSNGFRRLLVEDVSLGLDALGGFPGPYVKWLLQGAGGAGLAALAYALNDRSAVARCCVGYWDGTRTHLLVGEIRGTVLVEPRGQERFGWDPWFIPEGSKRTFAELSAEEKDRISHRGIAWRKVRELIAPVSAERDEVSSNVDSPAS